MKALTHGQAARFERDGFLNAGPVLTEQEVENLSAEFDRILADSEFYPALVNKGNIYYMQENNREALAYYERAFALRPNSPTVLLGLAQAHSELENYGTSKDYYAKLREIDAQLADAYSHLGLGSDSRTRASESADRVEWEDWEEQSENEQ